MARVRAFIAVEVGDEVRRKAVALQQQLARTGAGVKWVAADAMHLTLLFLGELDDRDILPVHRAMAAVAATEPGFPLRVSGVGAFPNARRPKVVWGGVTDGADALRRLYTRLEEKLLDLGLYRKEERDYTPHLTLGRVKGEADGFKLAPELPKLLAWDGGRGVVGELVLFSSELRRGGPEYTPLGRAELTG